MGTKVTIVGPDEPKRYEKFADVRQGEVFKFADGEYFWRRGDGSQVVSVDECTTCGGIASTREVEIFDAEITVKLTRRD